ncbi:cofilin-2-like isoform X2 [Vanacampus margaritifer]
MSSGVQVNDEVADLYKRMKFSKDVKVAFFCISMDKKEIIVDKDKTIMKCDVPQECVFDKFNSLLPSDDCRYIVYDVKYETKDSGEKESLLFISWNPDSCSILRKMLHASSKAYIKKELNLETEWCINGKEEAMDIRGMADSLKGAVCVEGKRL